MHLVRHDDRRVEIVARRERLGRAAAVLPALARCASEQVSGS
jgi:hypothetical protein